MMSRNFQQPMLVVDREEVPAEGHRLLEVNEAAHQAEVAAEAERIALNETESAMAVAATDAARRDAETHADAIRVVLRAKAREGHDLTAMRPADALAVEIIRRALDNVRHADAVKQEDSFNATSSPAEIAKGAAVSKIIGA